MLIKETDVKGAITRAEGYVYDVEGRRTHSVDEEGRLTQYEYDQQSRLSVVLYPWTEEKAEADRAEAEESGLYFTLDKGQGERYSFKGEAVSQARELLNRVSANRGGLVGAYQLVWRETYTYDENGNRATKTTPWGTIGYGYDGENRLTERGDIKLSHDKDGNLLEETGLRYEARYEYNGQNRMVYSEAARAGARRVVSRYSYDGLGRRTLEREEGGETMRRLYDGLGFEEIRAGAIFSDGSFTTRYATGVVRPEAKDEGMRYRWLGETGNGIRGGNATGAVTAAKYTGIQAVLYARGEAVGMNLTSSVGSRGGSVYLGKDILGSVRSSSGEYGTLEERYEYDAFGKPYKGDLDNGMSLGYTGKPYDATTGLYNYGYRDYKPETARFTTVDPVRDGSNWFAYVNNDPVNYIDPWGLSANDAYFDAGTAPELIFTAYAPDPVPQIPANPSDYNCDIFAFNGALEHGSDPRDQNGQSWDGNAVTVPEIYGGYPNDRYVGTAPANTAGYAFYDSPNDNDTIPEHMEYYDYRGGGDMYILYSTDGRETPVQVERPPNDNNRTFVPLPNY